MENTKGHILPILLIIFVIALSIPLVFGIDIFKKSDQVNPITESTYANSTATPRSISNNDIGQIDENKGVEPTPSKPSGADLSYITLFIDSGYEMKVSSDSGEMGDSYFSQEGPMMNPENPGEVSGVETLTSFYYPKPETGNYLIEIVGEGTYQLDYYLYDKSGEKKVGNIEGTTASGSLDTYKIKFDKLNIENTEFID